MVSSSNTLGETMTERFEKGFAGRVAVVTGGGRHFDDEVVPVEFFALAPDLPEQMRRRK